MSWIIFLCQGRYPENFVLISLLEVRQEGGYLEDIEGSWPETWRTESFLTSWIIFFTPRKIPWKFRVDISIRSVSRMGGQEGGYLEDVNGSWPETWRSGSSLTSWMMMFDPKEDTLKVSCWYLYGKCVCVISRNACDEICPSLFRTGWYVVNICIIAKFLMEINIIIFFLYQNKMPLPSCMAYGPAARPSAEREGRGK